MLYAAPAVAVRGSFKMISTAHTKPSQTPQVGGKYVDVPSFKKKHWQFEVE